MEDTGLYNQLMQRAAQQTSPSASGDVWSKVAAPKGPPHGGTMSGPPPMPQPAQPSKAAAMAAPPPQGAQGAAPAAQRYATGEAVKQAVANGWNPNPVLLRAAIGR